jgi:hypothetical protein
MFCKILGIVSYKIFNFQSKDLASGCLLPFATFFLDFGGRVRLRRTVVHSPQLSPLLDSGEILDKASLLQFLVIRARGRQTYSLDAQNFLTCILGGPRLSTALLVSTGFAVRPTSLCRTGIGDTQTSDNHSALSRGWEVTTRTTRGREFGTGCGYASIRATRVTFRLWSSVLIFCS